MCSVGTKAEKDFGVNIFWVFGGIPTPGLELQKSFICYMILSKESATHILENHEIWLKTPGKKG